MDTLVLTTDESSATVRYPTITSLIEALQEMQNKGADANQPLMISQLGNAPGVFHIYTIKNN
jgi:hypothetical protein